MSTIISSTLKFIVATILVSWMIHEKMLNLHSLSELSNPIYLITSLLLVFFVIFVNNLRWTTLLKMHGFDTSARKTMPLTLMGIFFNFALPGGVGGDVIKGYYLLRSIHKKKTLASTTILLDRIIGMYGMIFISMVTMSINLNYIKNNASLYAISLSVILAFILISLFFVLSFSTKINNHKSIEIFMARLYGGSFIRRVYDCIHSYRNNPRSLINTFILSIISQLSIIIFVWFFAKITGAPDVSLYTYVFIVPLGLICTVLPITPAGIGVGQAAMFYLYQLYTGINNQIGPNALTAYQVMLFCWGLLGAYFYISKKKIHTEKQMI